MMNGISPSLYSQLEAILLRCGLFESDTSLRSLFADGRIKVWQHDLPTAKSPGDRVRITINFLHDRSDEQGESALVLFLHVLMDHTQGQADYNELANLLSVLAPPIEITNTPTQEEDDDDVEFVNRVVELNQVMLSAAQTQTDVQYWTIDAPAGFGKTRFLLECQKRYTAQGWSCAYVTMSPQSGGIETLAHQIKEILNVETSWRAGTSAKKIGRYIGTCLVPEFQLRGIAIFIDNVEAANTSTLSELIDLITNIYDGLKMTAFFTHQNRLQFFLAGRYIHRNNITFRSKNLPVRELTLSPHTFTVILTTVQMYVLRTGAPPLVNILPNIAAELMYLNGGHPGCTAGFLKQQAGQPLIMALDSLQDTPEDSVARIYPILNDLSGCNDNTRQLIPIMDTLSIFRRYGSWLLKILMDKGYITWDGDCYALQDALSKTYLIERKRGFLQDGITRRLFAIRLRHENQTRFQEICNEGELIYKKRLETGNERHPVEFAVEYMYQHLHYAYYVKNMRSDVLKQDIQDTLVYILETLMNKLDDPRGTKSDFIEVLKQDWELEFLTNYMLKGDDYDSGIYNAIVQKLHKSV